MDSKAAITKIEAILIICVIVLAGGIGGAIYYFTTLPKEPETIKIGVPLPITGVMALESATISDGAILAMDEINARGGVLGKKIELVFADNEGKAAVGTAVMERLIVHDKVVAIAGFLFSSVAIACVEVTHKYGIPVIVTNANSDSITEKHRTDGYDEIFRVIGNTTSWGQAYAEFMYEALGNGRLETYALLMQEAEYSRQISETITEWFEQNHPEVQKVAHLVAKEFETDYYPTLTQIKAANPQVLYTDPTGVGMALVTKQKYELDINCMEVGWGVIRYVSDFIELAGPDAAEYYTFGPHWDWTPALLEENPRAKLYYDLFMARRNKEPSEYSAHQYNAIHVLALAIEEAGSTDPTKIKEALEETDWMGVKGRITFAATTGQNENDPVLFQQIQNGTAVAVWPFDLAAGPVKWPPDITPP